MNANKSLLDVWLIYQCPKCRHTYNLPVYERVKTSRIEPEAYRRFLGNDADTAFRCGPDKRLFDRSRAEREYWRFCLVPKANIFFCKNFGLVIAEGILYDEKKAVRIVRAGRASAKNMTERNLFFMTRYGIAA